MISTFLYQNTLKFKNHFHWILRNVDFSCCSKLSLKKLKHFSVTFRYWESSYWFRIFERKMNSKPPNIFIFTGNDCSKLFKNIEDSLYQSLQPHHYLVYHLLLSEVKKQPWIENTTLLIAACDEIDDGIAETFENYLYNGGKILLICSKFNKLVNGKCIIRTADRSKLVQIGFKDIEKTFVFRGEYSYYFTGSTVISCDSNGTPVINKLTFNKGDLISSEVYLDRDPDVLPEDPVFLKYDRVKRLMVFKNVLAQEFGLKIKTEESFVPQLSPSPGYFMSDISLNMDIMNDLNLNDCEYNSVFRFCTLPHTFTEMKLPIYYTNEDLSKSISFDKNLYFSNLKTDIYGHSLVYFSVISSTMDVVGHLSDYDGIVIVAGCQISGKGRGGNKWISPEGCAMFTLCFTLSFYSNLGQKLPLIQHIAALSFIHGIRKQEQYKKLNLKLKWPNDIYFHATKIGGLIVASTIQDKLAHVSIGWGINVSNDHPTLCLNSVIEEYNLENSCNLPYLHREEVIAATVSQMEYFVKDFQNLGPGKFFNHYYSYWMHDLQEVTLVNLNKKGIITGLNDFGFLVVKTENGEEISLQPDGNRFDIMRNLIHLKE